MKHIIKSTILVIGFSLPVIYACSQAPPPPGALPAGPGRRPGGPPPGPEDPGGPGRPLQQLTTVKGTLNAYVANDRLEYDMFTLQNSGQSMTVHFPAHMGVQLMAAANPGSAISVEGFYETTPEGQNVFHLVDAIAGEKTIYDTPPVAPANPPAESVVSFNGTIASMRTDLRGTPNGLVLADKTTIDLPPGTYEQLQGLLKPGATISGSGLRVVAAPGVVLVQNTRIIHPQTLAINGQTYMVR